MALLAVSGLSCMRRDEAPPEYAKARVLVKMVNKYCREVLGFKNTPNFQTYSSAKSGYMVYRMSKTKLKHDNLHMIITEKKFSDEKSARAYAEQFEDKEDVYVYKEGPNSSSYPITDDFLRQSMANQIDAIVHEDWHRNVSFSLSLEEATGDLLGQMAAIKIFKRNGQKEELAVAEYNFRWTMAKSRVVVKYYNLLQELYAKRNNGMDEGTIEYFREEILNDARREFWELEQKTGLKFTQLKVNNASLSVWITYDRYRDLCRRVYLGTDRDLAKTAEIFRGIKSLGRAGLVKEFIMTEDEIKRYEKEQVQYLEKYAVEEK
jgi:hypothetical protein